MMKDTFPPTISLPTRLVFDARLPHSLIRIYARLLAAPRQADGLTTQPLHIDREIVPLLGVGYRQAYRRLCQLRQIGLIDWTTNGKGSYALTFPGFTETRPAASLQEQERQDNHRGSVVVVGESDYQIKSPQQHQHRLADLNNPDQQLAPDGLNGESYPDRAALHPTAVRWLLRAGVWPDVAERIADLLALNQRRQAEHLPGLADLLGWMAYCFRDREANKVENSTALLVSNLLANRRCPKEYLPRFYCADCCLDVSRCDCDAGPDPHLPESFLEAALAERLNKYTAHLSDRWGVCQSCRAVPCQC